MNNNKPLIVAWGGGVNSTAMIIELLNRNIIPDLILFADTGGEKPETYQYIEKFNLYLTINNSPTIIVVKNASPIAGHKSLEDECLKSKTLPSLAYGWKKCSEKWKRRPQDRYCNSWPIALEIWENGNKCIKAIGYDINEERRAKIANDNKYDYWHPLIEWKMGREECVDVIIKSGLEVPLKSSCFFCPASKKSEIIWLYENHRDLYDKAVELERNSAEGRNTVLGLGRHWSWENMIQLYKDGAIQPDGKKTKACKLNVLQNIPIMTDPDDAPCGCYDGESNNE